MLRTRRWTVLAVVVLLVAGGIATLCSPARRSAGGAVPARAEAAKRILQSLGGWDAASHEERRAAAAWVGAQADGFVFDGTEEFGFDGHRHEIAVFAHAATGLEFSLIPGGTFSMGSSEGETGRAASEGPQHTVTISAAFLLCRTETTQAAWERVMGANPSMGTIGADHPVDKVSWDDAQNFCGKTGLRLPSEAEWEYASRAGTTTRFWSGDQDADLDRVGWTADNTGSKSYSVVQRALIWAGATPAPGVAHRPVGRMPANPFGLHDMLGNVWEWCSDTYNNSFVGAPADGSAWMDAKSRRRVVRGGSYYEAGKAARSASRTGLAPQYKYPHFGFRPAASITW